MAVHLITLNDMLDEFARRVGNPRGNTRWDEATTQVQWFNLGQTEVCEETRCLEEDWTSSVAAWSSSGDEILTLPNNCYSDGIIAVWWIDSSNDMTRLKEKHAKLDSIKNTDTGTPTSFFKVGDNIHLMPLPGAAGTVRIHGERMPDELLYSAKDTAQSLIPAPFRDLPVMYALIQAWTEDGEFDKAMLEERRYRQKIGRLRKMVQARRTKTRQPRFSFGF
jgi:hypothetical protein